MAYLTAAVIVVGVLALLNLVLTVGVIRRLREHTTRLSQVPAGMSAGLPLGSGLQPGETVEAFSTISDAGKPVSHESFTGRTLVGFFSPGCAPCTEQLPKFVAYAESLPGGRDRVLAVVSGSEESDYQAKLAPVAQVVTEEPDGPIQAAFQVNGFPTVYLVDAGGTVAAGSLSVDALHVSVAEAPVATTV